MLVSISSNFCLFSFCAH